MAIATTHAKVIANGPRKCCHCITFTSGEGTEKDGNVKDLALPDMIQLGNKFVHMGWSIHVYCTPSPGRMANAWW